MSFLGGSNGNGSLLGRAAKGFAFGMMSPSAQAHYMDQKREDERQAKLKTFLESDQGKLFEQQNPQLYSVLSSGLIDGRDLARSLGVGNQSPASVKEWEYYNNLPSDKQQKFMDLKRNNFMNMGGYWGRPDMNGGISAVPGGEKTLPPEQTPEHKRQVSEAQQQGEMDVRMFTEPELAKRIAEAEERVKADFSTQADDRKRASALAVYETSMAGVMEAFGMGNSGPWIGMLPALSQDQKKLEGSIAALAPTLKNVFREAGEGTFTNDDQRLLNEMAPKRTDQPDVAMWKAQNLDNIVRMKLNGQPVDVESYYKEYQARFQEKTRLKYNPQTGDFE